MDMMTLIKSRHSVRQYDDRPVADDALSILRQEMETANKEAGLNFQMVVNDSNAFNTLTARYGRFRGVKNYIAVVGPKSKDLNEKCGYYGEHLVLKAQELGLNTCWVGMTYGKNLNAFKVGKNEKLIAVIIFGYGVTQGVAHRSKNIWEVSNVSETTPDWFRLGVEAALLAPTAVNQQNFFFKYSADDKVTAKAKLGINNKTDLGIVKYHFESVTGRKVSD